VAHEGAMRDRYFYVSANGRKQASDISGSLMLYGRQIFQLCISTLLVGIDLAERADLREKFVANNERYQQICKLLEGKVGTADARLLNLAPIIRALERYRFVASGIDPGPQLAATRLAANTLVECQQRLPEDLAKAVSDCAASKRADGEFQQLAVIEAANAAFEKQELSLLTPETRIVRDIINLVWMTLFPRYFWLKNRNSK
jgi:hypothetical protein